MATKTNKAPAKVKAPAKKKGSSKAALVKQLEAKGMFIPADASAAHLKHILDNHRSPSFWMVRLVGATYKPLVEVGIDSKKLIYALPDTKASEAILNTRRLVILKRTTKPFSNAVVIDSFKGESDGSNE